MTTTFYADKDRDGWRVVAVTPIWNYASGDYERHTVERFTTRHAADQAAGDMEHNRKARR